MLGICTVLIWGYLGGHYVQNSYMVITLLNVQKYQKYTTFILYAINIV